MQRDQRCANVLQMFARPNLNDARRLRPIGNEDKQDRPGRLDTHDARGAIISEFRHDRTDRIKERLAHGFCATRMIAPTDGSHPDQREIRNRIARESNVMDGRAMRYASEYCWAGDPNV